jgi:putative membrane protein
VGKDMANEFSLVQSMDKAVKHYSSLFQLPSYKRAILILALLCIGGGVLSAIVPLPNLTGLVNGLFLGFSLFLTNLIVDRVTSVVLLKDDPIYDLRRTVALSLFCWIFWLFFIILGIAIAVFTSALWLFKLWLFGFFAVLIFRFVVLSSTSSNSYKRLILTSILQPFLCIVPFIVFWAQTGFSVGFYMVPYIVLALGVCFVSSFLFIHVLNSEGERALGVPSLRLFKAFLLDWVVGVNVPFEDFLEKLGEKRDVEVSLIKFDSSKPKAVIAVPSIHPGPFKNVGSSLLPFMLKNTLERKLNCVACVPHGLFGHEFDLASQPQNLKIIDQVVELADVESAEARATPFVKVSNGLATACCQIFGNCAFLSFTLAPKTTEDLPQELGFFVRKEAERHGLDCCVVVNAHNSIDGTLDTQEALEALKMVAAKCLENAVSTGKLPFEIGAATVTPREYNLKDGMGPGGITVVIVEVGKQKTAYVVIDGNNMVAGLREKILSALGTMGIDAGEVFTTDTHSVNAVVLNQRGYHPLGEVINHENFINHIKEATLAAMSNLEHVKVGYRTMTVSNVTVIGEKLLETLCNLIDKTIQKAKRVVAPIFGVSGLILTLLLLYV